MFEKIKFREILTPSWRFAETTSGPIKSVCKRKSRIPLKKEVKNYRHKCSKCDYNANVKNQVMRHEALSEDVTCTCEFCLMEF